MYTCINLRTYGVWAPGEIELMTKRLKSIWKSNIQVQVLCQGTAIWAPFQCKDVVLAYLTGMGNFMLKERRPAAYSRMGVCSGISFSYIYIIIDA